MPSSMDPAATQEFKISALPTGAAEDSDLISALTKLVNEVYASAEDGAFGPNAGGQYRRIRYASPPRPATGASASDGNLSDSARRKHATRDAALCSFGIYRKAIRAGARAAAQEPPPAYRNRLPCFSHVRKINLRLARVPGGDNAGPARFHRNAVMSLPVIASRDHLHDPAKRKEMKW
jgi:hypothetical protein